MQNTRQQTSLPQRLVVSPNRWPLVNGKQVLTLLGRKKRANSIAGCFALLTGAELPIDLSKYLLTASHTASLTDLAWLPSSQGKSCFWDVEMYIWFLLTVHTEYSHLPPPVVTVLPVSASAPHSISFGGHGQRHALLVLWRPRLFWEYTKSYLYFTCHFSFLHAHFQELAIVLWQVGASAAQSMSPRIYSSRLALHQPLRPNLFWGNVKIYFCCRCHFCITTPPLAGSPRPAASQLF